MVQGKINTNHVKCITINLFIFSIIFSVDSIMLVENGFDVVSVDASDKMLKYALKERWNRRTEKGFDSWSKYV